MNTKELAERIKNHRTRKGFSQEELSNRSGLSLRTIQRIENGETVPRGDSLQRLSAALQVTPDELTDWLPVEDKGYLLALNLSSLLFLFLPLLGIFAPLIVWLSRKDKVQGANQLAKRLLNFQLTWNAVFFAALLFSIIFMATNFQGITSSGDVSPTTVAGIMKVGLGYIELVTVLMYLYNILFILINTRRVSRGKEVNYFPSIRFMRVD